MESWIVAPNLGYEALRAKADEFLRRYHPSLEIPIPIEEIVDLQFGINIIPIPGLHQAFEIDGFTSSDLSAISVDEFVFEHRVERYRYTLAHELGHCLLHSDLFRGSHFKSVGEWKNFVNSVPEREYSSLEYQAYSFAGLILVPRKRLMIEVDLAVQMIRDEGISLESEWDMAWEVISDYLGKKDKFFVSGEVITKRIYYDKIQDNYRPQK